MHPALFYADSEEYLSGLVPFITGGLAADEPVLVAVPEERIELLRGGLRRAADHVLFVDMTEAGRNPGRIIPRVLRAFVDQHPTRPTRVIGGAIWAGRSATEYPACVQHEALINIALAHRPVSIVCPYDASRLDPTVLADAASTHPLLIEHGQWRPSPRFADPAAVVQAWNQPLLDPPDVPTTLIFTAPDGPRQVRRVAHEVAEREGLTGPRATSCCWRSTNSRSTPCCTPAGPGSSPSGATRARSSARSTTAGTSPTHSPAATPPRRTMRPPRTG